MPYILCLISYYIKYSIIYSLWLPVLKHSLTVVVVVDAAVIVVEEVVEVVVEVVEVVNKDF